MDTKEKANARDKSDASVIRSASIEEKARADGIYTIECFDSKGKLKWRDKIENVVTIVGKNLALDTYLAGSGYTVTGPYMGLISSVDWSAVSENDTMSSHAGWKEAGPTNAPNYSGDRKTCAWSAAASGSKSLSAPLEFTMSESGTVKGCFVVYGTGAVATKDDTNGTLYSAGTFTGGDKVVVDTDVLKVSYTASL